MHELNNAYIHSLKLAQLWLLLSLQAEAKTEPSAPPLLEWPTSLVVS